LSHAAANAEGTLSVAKNCPQSIRYLSL